MSHLGNLDQWFDGRSTIVTGGSGGMGRAIALAFAAAGYEADARRVARFLTGLGLGDVRHERRDRSLPARAEPQRLEPAEADPVAALAAERI